MQASLVINIHGTFLNILIIYYDFKMDNDKFHPQKMNKLHELSYLW
jgi:hypothetical protein